MIEKQIIMFLSGIKKECEKQCPCCLDCQFYSPSYFGCKYRDFINLINCDPKNVNMRLVRGMLNEQTDD